MDATAVAHCESFPSGRLSSFNLNERQPIIRKRRHIDALPATAIDDDGTPFLLASVAVSQSIAKLLTLLSSPKGS